jgi:Sulfotransferase family
MKIFMIGTQRSGSNLLRLMVNQAPTIAAPHPPHILERFAPLVPSYGDLSDEAAFMHLIDDVVRLVEVNPVSWGVDFDRADIRRRCRDNSLVAIFGSVMDRMAEAHGKPDWMCKSLANVHFLPEIERYFGADARYLYLYRDGRDVCVSFLKAVVGEKTAFHVGQQWNVEQQLALECGRRVLPSQYLALSYEELTSKPEATLRSLCSWLGIDFHPAMLDFHASAEASRTAASGKLWENVKKPVMSSNTQKWLKGMSCDQVIDFESVAGSSLRQLDYELVLVGKHAAARQHDAAAAAAFELENRRLKAAVRESMPAEDLAARKPQEDLLAAIRSRGLSA